MAVPDSLNQSDNGGQYVVEGIGYDFIPDVLNRKDVDTWLKTDDEESFAAVQKLMRNEGLLVGGSSGSALSGALRWLKSDQGRGIANTPGKNVVVILPDGYVSVISASVIRPNSSIRIRNYMSKPWFLKLAMEGESPLAGTIAQVLGKTETPKDAFAKTTSAAKEAALTGNQSITLASL